MTTFVPSTLLRRVLMLDAATSAAAGLVLVAGAGYTADLLGLPASFQRGAGLALLVFAAFVAALASRETPPRLAVWAVVAINAFWAVDSVLLLLFGSLAPTALGIAFVAAQAVVVAVLAELQVLGLRRSRPAFA